MHPPYRTIARAGSIELEIKKSRFTCHLERASSDEQARAFIADIKKRHWDANHNCSAYVVGERGDIQRTSDDGEPSGTAGVPMLNVLLKRELTDTVAVVTRYFGGVKLGAGGLIRAYGQAVSDAVNEVGVVVRKDLSQVAVTAGFEDAGRLENAIRADGREPDDVEYGERVTILLTLDPADVPDFESSVAEQTSGRATVETRRTVHAEVPEGDLAPDRDEAREAND
jgi:uncharacterized YigZ family protein